MQIEEIKAIILTKSVKLFEFVWTVVFGITVAAVFLSCFIVFSYKGIKYLYTFTESEISHYRQKKEDSINEKIAVEARLAFETYREQGLSGLVSLSKNRYEFLERNKVSIEDLYRIATIDIVGENLDEVFLDNLSAIAEKKTDQESISAITTALKSEYFRKSLTNTRISQLRKFASDQTTPDTETLRFFIQKVFKKW